MNFSVMENVMLHPNYSLLKLVPVSGEAIPHVSPGQFVQVEVDNSKSTFLRRPISINNVDYVNNELWLLVRRAGAGTDALMRKEKSGCVNLLLPLGNGFSMDAKPGENLLLIGGGVGVAPLLYFGKKLKEAGLEPNFLLGARSAADLLELDEFSAVGNVYISTDDGSTGEHGVVTQNSVLRDRKWDKVYCCGPAPMMKAVAKTSREIGAECEVSLENMMACGLGACLCCVEKTVRGNVCVCTEGPVFNIKELTW